MDQDEDQGIIAYHGSPHDFEQFDTSKIGTGEGAQVYGHGLYFAGNEDVAKSYRDKLAMGQSTLDGRPMSEIASEKYKLPYGEQPALEHDIADIVSSYGDTARYVLETRHPHLLSQYDQLVSEGRIKEPGHMYEVHIDAHPDHFLDWDEVLEDQNHYIKTALQRVADHDEAEKGYTDLHEHLADPDAYTGGAFYQNLADRGRAKEASEILSQMGIKGIRYKDAGSRFNDEKPSYNYVVFNHDHVNVRRKYEQGGAV